MEFRRTAVIALSAAAALVIVAGCTSGADGNGTPSATATVTATATDTVSSAAPPTGSGVPASTPPATGTSSGSGTASGPGLCTPTVMTFTVGRNGGAAGSTYFEVHATNASKTPCVTTGFPGIAFLDAAGRQVLQAVRDDPDRVTTIVVQPGRQVSAQVRAESTDAANGGGECPSSPAFLFTLPDNTDSTRLVHTTPVCSVSVAAFVEGAGT